MDETVPGAVRCHVPGLSVVQRRAPTGRAPHVGIDDTFISARQEATPGTSAMFVLTSDAVRDRVQEASPESAPSCFSRT